MNKKIAVIGCGNVGTQFSFLAASFGYDLLLYDVVDGLSTGRALDISQAQRPLDFASQVRAIESLDEAVDCNLWVITAGKARQPGMTRADLASVNIQIISEIALHARKCRKDTVFLIVTNPLDVIVSKFVEISGVERYRVLGMGGILDSARMSYFASLVSGCPARDIEAWVLGAHSDSMVPCFSLTRIGERKAEDVLSAADMKWVAEKTVRGGAEIVSCLKTGSAFLAPGACAFRLARAVLEDEKILLPVSVYTDGEWGFKGAAIGLPCRVGSSGIEKVEELPLSAEEAEKLEMSFEEVKSFLMEV